MRIRRNGQHADFRELPLDGVDMFLLTRLDGSNIAVAVKELLDIAPCDAKETLRRLRQLERLGVVELLDDPERDGLRALQRAAQTANAPLAVRLEVNVSKVDIDEAVTLRPPRKAGHTVDFGEPETAPFKRPPRGKRSRPSAARGGRGV